MNLILIVGMPASGKSYFARTCGAHFGYPVLEKDEFKEILFDTLGFDCYAVKRRMDYTATLETLHAAEAMLKAGQSVIIVNNFRDDNKQAVLDLIERYRCACVTVFFGGDSDAFYRRYVERDNKHLRHLGHVLQDRYPPLPGDSLDYEMTREEFAEKFEKLGMDQFTAPGGRIDLDATWPEKIDAKAVLARIEQMLRAQQ
ncbi:MAG: AAA family ATPase [Clostridia bacterium]|nr:AAA family ATPase [Clostridia bacterium]